jgi:heat shock protein HslJ
MACPGVVMPQSTAFYEVLRQTADVQGDGQQISLVDASGKTLATFIAQNTTLAGTAWVVTGYNNGKQAVVSVIADTTITVEFNTDGRMSGLAGCNSYTAKYEVTGKGIKIALGVPSAKLCTTPAGIMEQDSQFLRALATAATYRVEGDRLELRTADGALAVQLEKGK